MFSRLTPEEQSLRHDFWTSNIAWYSSAWGLVNLTIREKHKSAQVRFNQKEKQKLNAKMHVENN